MSDRRLFSVPAAVPFSFLLILTACSGQGSPTFGVSFAESLSPESLDGRVILILSTDEASEPRFQVNSGPAAPMVLGVDVNGLAPGSEAVIDSGVFGFPIESLSGLPAGEYWVQAVLHKYETFNLANGKTVKLPMDRGEGQHWQRAPGNLYSTPRWIQVDPSAGGHVSIELDQEIPPITPAEDTEYVKHVRIQSDLLTEFWGRPMHLGAHVLLPEGFDEHPEARYPLVVFHGHFPADFGGFRTEPPDPDLEPTYSARFDVDGYNRIQQQEAYDFYRKWIGPDFPRMLIISVQHANPYYDDSYAVNSANLGPYGDAITYELIPEIERRFRGIGQGWARGMHGGSTGGWEVLGAQIFYPEEYNGVWAACPDVVNFHFYRIVPLYDAENAYYEQTEWRRIYRPGYRNTLGELRNTFKERNLIELVIGTNSRSGGQHDIWPAVFGPVGDDGYPAYPYDKWTGEIDREVVEYWRENYDLTHILQRDWATLGPQLEGKLHVFMGDMDNGYLNNAVYILEEFLESTTNPYYGGVVEYGDRQPHCYSGHDRRYWFDQLQQRILSTAPPGADLASWLY